MTRCGTDGRCSGGKWLQESRVQSGRLAPHRGSAAARPDPSLIAPHVGHMSSAVMHEKDTCLSIVLLQTLVSLLWLFWSLHCKSTAAHLMTWFLDQHSQTMNRQVSFCLAFQMNSCKGQVLAGGVPVSPCKNLCSIVSVKKTAFHGMFCVPFDASEIELQPSETAADFCCNHGSAPPTGK